MGLPRLRRLTVEPVTDLVHPGPDDEVQLEDEKQDREPLLSVQGLKAGEPGRRRPPGRFPQKQEHGRSTHEDPQDGEDPMVERDRDGRGNRTRAFGLNWGVFSQTVKRLF